MEKFPLGDADWALIEAALATIDKNYDGEKYNHTVGCGLGCKNGRIYTAVNCDGNHGSCAEYIAMGCAVSAGEREFETIVAVHRGHPNHVLAPCGNCRQMLLEYCPEILVIVNDEEGRPVKVKARDLLPFA